MLFTKNFILLLAAVVIFSAQKCQCAAENSSPFTLLVMSQCEVGAVTKKLVTSNTNKFFDTDFRFKKGFVDGESREQKQLNCSGQQLVDDHYATGNTKDSKVIAKHANLVQKTWTSDLENTNFNFRAKKEISRPDAGDSGFRASMNFSGSLEQKTESLPHAKESFLANTKSCKLKIVDILPQGLQFDVENLKDNTEGYEVFIEENIDIELPAYNATQYVYSLEIPLTINPETFSMDFNIEFPIAVRYGFPNNSGKSIVKVSKGAFYYISNCDQYVAVHNFRPELGKERILDLRSPDISLNNFEENYLRGRDRWAIKLVNQETSEKNYMELELTVGVLGDLELHDFYAQLCMLLSFLIVLFAIYQSYICNNEVQSDYEFEISKKKI